jgi:hypothetical protein
MTFLESERPGTRKTWKRRNAGVRHGQITECAAGLAADRQARDSTINQRRAEAAAVG